MNESKYFPVAIVALLTTAFASTLDSGYYMGKWLPICIALSLYIAIRLKNNCGWIAGALYLYLMASATWVTLYANRYASVKPYDLQALKMFAFDSAWKLTLLAVPLAFVRLTRYRKETLRETGYFFALLFFVISAAEVAWQWIHPLHGPSIGHPGWEGCTAVNACGGALLNPSLNSAMMASLLPLLPLWPLMVTIAAACAFAGKTSIGAGMVALFVGGKAVSQIRATRSRGALALLIAGVPAIFLLGILTHHGKAFFDSSGRFQMWWFFMRLWAMNPRNWIFGTGFGTFGVFSVNLQHAFAMNASDWWVWIHNDWLQMLFEAGAVGSGLMVALYGFAVRRLYIEKSTPELGSLLLFGVGMGCEYFLHIGPCCAYAAWILAIALLRVDNPDLSPQNPN